MTSLLYVSNFEGSFAGADRSLVALLNELPDDVSSTVVCPRGASGLAKHLAKPGRVSLLDLSFDTFPFTITELQRQAPAGRRLEASLAYLFADNLLAVERLSRMIDLRNLDVVHSNTSCVALGALVATLWSRPHVWHVRETLAFQGEAQRVWMSFMRQFADAVVAPSDTAAAAFGPPCEVVPDLFDQRTIQRLARTAEGSALGRLGLAEDDILVVAAANSTPAKGHEVLVRAFADALRSPGLAEASKRARLIVAGNIADPAHRRRLEELAASVGVAPQLSLAGPLAYGETLALLARAAVVVHPSVLPETFAGVPMEALLLGTPVIVTDAVPLAELLQHEVTALVCRAGDAPELAESLARVLGSPSFARSLADRGKEWASAYCQRSSGASPYLDLYRTVASRADTTGPIAHRRAALRWLRRATRRLAERSRILVHVGDNLAARTEELASVKEVLRAHDEELASIKEVFHAHHEELVSVKEALRARDEELAAVKEELRAREQEMQSLRSVGEGHDAEGGASSEGSGLSPDKGVEPGFGDAGGGERVPPDHGSDRDGAVGGRVERPRLQPMKVLGALWHRLGGRGRGRNG